MTKRILNDIVDLIEILFNEVTTDSKRNYNEQNEFEADISERIYSIRYDIEQLRSGNIY